MYINRSINKEVKIFEGYYMEIIMEAHLWEKIKMKIIAIERKYDKIIKNSFVMIKKLQSEFEMKFKVLTNNFTRKLENLQRANKKIKMKSYRQDEKLENIFKIFQNKYENFKNTAFNENNELANLLKEFQNVLEKNQCGDEKNEQYDDPLLDVDPEIDSYVANIVSMVNQRKEADYDKQPRARRRSEIESNSLENSHSIGDWKDDLDDNSLDNSQQDKILFPHLFNKGGPVKKEESSLPSAEWNSDLEDDSKEEITTLEIKEFFPEYYECIEKCDDEVQRVCVKQMVKLELNKEIKEIKENNKNNSQMFESSNSLNLNSASPMRDFASKIHKAHENEIIKVFNYDGIDEKQLSITTPRAEFQNSNERNEAGFNHIGEKTISKHTFEENDFMNDHCLDSSLNTIYLSKESKSNEKQNRNSDLSSLCHNSNEKRSYEHNEIHSARHNDNNKLQSERSHSQCAQEGSNKKEKRVIHVIGRNNGHIKVPMISIGKCESNNVSREAFNEINDSKVESNRSCSSRNAGHSNEGDKNLNGFAKYLPISSSSRNSSRDLPYQNKCSSEGMRNSESSKADYNKVKMNGKDLEVIKESHSEFSNSNSVIETFRNKRKSNISSSGNNSGDQVNNYNAKEMINEEDEEDNENETTSFRCKKKIIQRNITIEESKETKQQDNGDMMTPYNEIQPNNDYFNRINKNIKVFHCFNRDSPFQQNKTKYEPELSPIENYTPSQDQNIQLKNLSKNDCMMKFNMSSSDNRLSRSLSSDNPSNISRQKECITIENNEDQMLLYNHWSKASRFIKDAKFLYKGNNMNLQEFGSEADENCNKYRFDQEITHDGSQLMKSPSMGSIRMDYKDKTAEFEGEDFSQNQPSEKKKPTNRPIVITKNKFVHVCEPLKDDQQYFIMCKEDLKRLSKLFINKLETKNSKDETSMSNLNNKLRSSILISDSNGTYKGPVYIHPCSSLTYVSDKNIMASQTFKTYLKGQEYFDYEGGLKNSSFINCNEYYPELRKEFKKTKDDDKNELLSRFKSSFLGERRATGLNSKFNGSAFEGKLKNLECGDEQNDVSLYTLQYQEWLNEKSMHFINEAAINEKNNLLYTPFAGILFCTSLDSHKVHTSDLHFKFNPTAKNVKLNLQSSKGSEATTSKAMTKYIYQLKLKNKQNIVSPKELQ